MDTLKNEVLNVSFDHNSLKGIGIKIYFQFLEIANGTCIHEKKQFTFLEKLSDMCINRLILSPRSVEEEYVGNQCKNSRIFYRKRDDVQNGSFELSENLLSSIL